MDFSPVILNEDMTTFACCYVAFIFSLSAGYQFILQYLIGKQNNICRLMTVSHPAFGDQHLPLGVLINKCKCSGL